MARRFLPPDILAGYALSPKRWSFRPFTWKVIGILSVLIVIVIPTYVIAERTGSRIIPEITSLFYKASNPYGSVSSVHLPPFPSILPMIGKVTYIVQEGDSCDTILAYHMHFDNASEVFSDQKPETVRMLGADIGRDCHELNQGITLSLSPQYPLIAFGGQVLRVGSLTSPQGLPTPLIHLPHAERESPDCTQGCLLSVKIAPRVQVFLTVFTSADIFPGSWIWSQATLARKVVANFAEYPYADPAASLNGMALQACDFQVNGAPAQTQTSSSCDDLTNKNIRMDGGAWLFGVTSPSALGHWHYPLNVPSGSRVLIWLSNSDKGLAYHAGDPVYRYDQVSHGYVKL